MMSKELVQIIDNQVVTTSLIIAEGTRNKHKSVVSLIREHKKQLTRWGQIRISDLKSLNPEGGRPIKVVVLNEQQATFLVTLLRNNDVVVSFKSELVDQFYKMRDHLNSQHRPLTRLEAYKELVKMEEERLALEEAYQKEKERADENQEVKELYDTSVAQNNYWIPMKAVADILDCVGVGRTNLYRFLRDEGVLTSKNEPMRQYQENGFMKTSYYSDWLGQYVCVVSFKGLKFIFKKLKNANKIPRSTTFEDWVALCRDMVVQDDKSESILTD